MRGRSGVENHQGVTRSVLRLVRMPQPTVWWRTPPGAPVSARANSIHAQPVRWVSSMSAKRD